MKLRKFVTEITVCEKDDSPIFGVSATKIGLDDDSGGAHITITQMPDSGKQVIRLEINEISHVISAIQEMAEVIQKEGL